MFSHKIVASVMVVLVVAATAQAMIGGLGGLAYNGYGLGGYGLDGLGYGGKGFGRRGYDGGAKSYDRGYSYSRGHDSGKAYGDAGHDMGAAGAGRQGLGRRGGFAGGEGFAGAPFLYKYV